MTAEPSVSLRDGGTVTLLLAKGVDCPSEYLHHPMVHVLDATAFTPADVSRCFPSNSRAIILTRNLPKRFYDSLQVELRRRKAVYLYRPTMGSIENELMKIVATAHPPSNGNGASVTVGEAAKITEVKVSAEKRALAAKGSIQALAAQADPTKSTAEEARRLFGIAKAQGITTTLGSLTQSISKFKRKHGLTDRPASAVPPETNTRLRALQVLDDAIAGLALVREYVEKVEGDNDRLMARIAKYQEIFKALGEADRA